MPNNQTTFIRVSGKKETIDELLKNVVVTEGYLTKIEQENLDIPDEFKIKPAKLDCVDFNILISKPKNWFKVSSCELDWNIDNWGTKWNAYNDEVSRCSDEYFQISFDTAWCCPFMWIKEFAEKAKELGVEYLEGESMDESYYYEYDLDWDNVEPIGDDEVEYYREVLGFKLLFFDDEMYLQWFRPVKQYEDEDNEGEDEK